MSDFDLDVLRDPDPPVPGPAERAAVRDRAARLRRRVYTGRGAIAFVVALAVALAGVAVAARNDGREAIVTSPPAPTTTPSTPAPPHLDPALSKCFPSVQTVAGPAPTGAISGVPANLPRLLILSRDGTIRVLDGARLTTWSSSRPYVWARFANDGTIYASRVTARPNAVVIDHLLAPDRVAVAAVRLPFTVKTGAPRGYCPIDGYLATFAINTAGLVLERHLPGPWDHSCPAPGTTDANGLGPCTSPEAVSPEVRAGGFATEPQGIDAGETGGMENIVSDARNGAAFASVGTDGVFVVRPGATPSCCFGGWKGIGFALSDDGSQIAWSSDGHGIAVLAFHDQNHPHGLAWRAADRITAMTWAGDTLAVVHGGHLTFVGTSGTNAATDVHGVSLRGTRTLDFAP